MVFDQNSPKCCQFCLKFWTLMICKIMHQICCGFYGGFKILSKLGERNWFFCSLWEIFCLPPNTPFELLGRFCKIKYIFVVNFISITVVVVKFKIFRVFCTTNSGIHERALFWRGWWRLGPIFPQIEFGFAEILTRGCLQ